MKKLRDTLLLLIITAPAYLSLLNNNYFLMHDDQHIARLFLLDRGIHQGYLFPRWVDALGFGYGYPLFNFYPPLTYYIGELFRLLGFSYIWSVKLIFISGFIIGALGIYLLVKKLIGRLAGFLAAVLYTFFSYHAVLAYVRGALAEFFALSVLPFVLLTLHNLYKERTLKNSLYLGLTLAALNLTHPLIALPSIFFIFFLSIFYLINLKKDKLLFIQKLVVAGLTGLSLSAFFWIPSIFERGYTLVDNILTRELASYKIHFVYPGQFLYSPWGYGGSIEGPVDGMSFQLGRFFIGLILLSIALFVAYILKKKKLVEEVRMYLVSLFLLIFALFMCTDYSGFIWSNVKQLSYLQFPWRFLTFTALFISITGSYVVYFTDKIFKNKIVNLAVVIILGAATMIIFQKYFYARPNPATDAKLTSYEEIAWRVSRTSHEFIPKDVATRKTELNTTIADVNPSGIARAPYEIIFGEAKVEVNKNKLEDKEFVVDASTTTRVRFNTYNFPGWHAYLGDKEIHVDDNNKLKLITINIPQGTHKLTLKFENTQVRTVGSIVSGASLLFVIYFLCRVKLKKVKG